MLTDRKKIVQRILSELYAYYSDTEHLYSKPSPALTRAVSEIFSYHSQQEIKRVSKKLLVDVVE